MWRILGLLTGRYTGRSGDRANETYYSPPHALPDLENP